MKKPILLIKLGGSSITDKRIPYKVREDVIRRFAKEIERVGNKYSLVISHGSGSFGHTSASKYGGKKGYKSLIGIATVSADAGRINQIVTDIFVQEGLPVISLSPTSMILAENGEITDHFFEVVEELLKQNLIPVVYGDVIWDRKWKSTIFSGEKTLNLLAYFLSRKGFKIDRVIQVGETDGLIDKSGKTVPRINKNNWGEVQRNIFNTGKIDVTGGMAHKVEEALQLSKKGIETLLISDKQNNLSSAIIRKPTRGTIIVYEPRSIVKRASIDSRKR